MRYGICGGSLPFKGVGGVVNGHVAESNLKSKGVESTAATANWITQVLDNKGSPGSLSSDGEVVGSM